MKRIRVIPTLLLKNNGLVKTIRFGNEEYIGDPINAIKIFNEKEVDELVFLDITATSENREPNYRLISEIASECFMPLSYGGGIKNIEQVRKIFKCGVEKIILNTSCYTNNKLIQEVAQIYGSQSIVASIDVKNDFLGREYVYVNSGKKNTDIKPLEYAVKLQNLGAGEIILNSINHEGTYSGYNYELIRKVSRGVDIPVVASGGASSIDDFRKAIEHGASAVAAGSLFVYYGRLRAVLVNYPSQKELKEKLYNTTILKENDLKTLHITSWYPNKYNTHKALFIKEHIDALNLHSKNYVIHIEVNFWDKKWGYESFKQSENEETIIIKFPFKIWLLVEVISFFILFYYLVIKKKHKPYDLINLYIAYPFGVFLNNVKRFVKKPFVITEQWTAYHYNFYTNKNIKGLNRIKNIYKNETPIVVVSKALADDIISFSDSSNLRYYTLHNVVDTSIFNCTQNMWPTEPVFFMLNMWSKIKQPFLAIDSFKLLLNDYPNAKLKIGGFGPLWNDMEKYVIDNNLSANISFLGKLDKDEIAKELNTSTALLHTSSYETFSVIAAESISCGVPVIALNLGGIPTFVNNANGFLHKEDTPEGWKKAMLFIIENKEKFNRIEIAEKGNKTFSRESVGKEFYKILKKEYNYFYLNNE